MNLSEHFPDSIERILVSQTNGLGDVVHSIPAIFAIAAKYPNAKIDLLAGHHACAIAEFVPVLSGTVVMDGYPRAKSKVRRYWQRARVAWRIVCGRYDLIVDLSPKDRSVFLMGLAGVRHRLAISFNAKKRLTWFYTDIATEQWRGEPFSRYISRALKSRGINSPHDNLSDCPINLSAVRTFEECGEKYIHLSLFGTEVARQLPISESRALIETLLQTFTSYRLVVSCASASREQEELAQILRGTTSSRVTVFAGTLSVPELAKLIQGAVLHIGPDTGSLHLAVLTGCKSVSWFINKTAFLTWAPRGPKHLVLLSIAEQDPVGQRLIGISSEDIVAAAIECLHTPRNSAEDSDMTYPNVRFYFEKYFLHHKAHLLPEPLDVRAAESVPAAFHLIAAKQTGPLQLLGKPEASKFEIESPLLCMAQPKRVLPRLYGRLGKG